MLFCVLVNTISMNKMKNRTNKKNDDVRSFVERKNVERSLLEEVSKEFLRNIEKNKKKNNNS